ncbi:hypothetical protein F5Y08DRAFT_343154 [Xylaria arbuscula]|nr:hypothetical protein F5Y08DRAFT_343154 [Xylaria arbuscula]
MASSSGQGEGNDPPYWLSQAAREPNVGIPSVPVLHDKRISRIDKISHYLSGQCSIFRTLMDLRVEGSQHPDKERFFNTMKIVGREIQSATSFFTIPSSNGRLPLRILDMGMAPGAFLQLAMEMNPDALAHAFTLPVENGGLEVQVALDSNAATIELVDVNMLAADLGVDVIPQYHPDAHKFSPRKLYPHDIFHLAICDAQVPSSNLQDAYRKRYEQTRLMYAQLAIALDHMGVGGSMLVFIHKIEAWDSIMLIRSFCMFSDVKLFKPTKVHAKRSSCYMVATNIQSKHEEAIKSVISWKQLWKTATFDTETMFNSLFESQNPSVPDVLEDFGPMLAILGNEAWEIQANALESWLEEIS